MTTEHIILEIKLPVPVRELAAISRAITEIHGKDVFMRQAGTHLQLYKTSPDAGDPGSMQLISFDS